MELLISIIIGVVIIEAYAWLPALCRWLVERAVSHLPTEDQERCREEWKASLETLPNTAVRLAHALSFILAARKVTAEFWEETFEELNTTVDELIAMRRDMERKREPLVTMAQEIVAFGVEQETEFARDAQELLTTITHVKDIVAEKIPPAVAQDMIESLLHLSAELPEVDARFLMSMRTEREKLLGNAERLIGQFRAADALLEKHLLVLGALQKRKLPSKDLEAAIGQACDDLMQDFDAWTSSRKAMAAASKCTDESGAGGVDTALAEFSRAIAGVGSVAAKLRAVRNSVPDSDR
jgi:hypothetical protein